MYLQSCVVGRSTIFSSSSEKSCFYGMQSFNCQLNARPGWVLSAGTDSTKASLH